MRHKTAISTSFGAAVLALLSLGLGGCVGRSDSMAPVVAITEPRSGTTRNSDDLSISGYAMDDAGIASIKVDGTDLLLDAQYASERGKRLVQFAFTKPNLKDGELTLTLDVTDVNGRRATERYVLTLDATPPTVELTKVEGIGGGKLRVEGVARDNMRLSSIRINGVPLAFTPGAEYSFSVDVDAVDGGQVVVEDSAGNVTAANLR
ncbi:MAG TPA: Ig-like domain-containing protein [Trueperaceae bacterium]|nr:Ig-like domain-containing protein [Trueperaceae bacterium]HRP47112.1 Ig-like domain-containing protein [Trueperaceae bacterium]